MALKKTSKAILTFPKCNIETTAHIGKNGLTTKKAEGDGKTPIGEFELGIVLSRKPLDENKVKVKHLQITKHMYWVDDPKSKYYNQLVDTSLKIQKDWNSAEHLIDYKIQYEYLIEIKTNPRNISKKGSAIFLHCTNNMETSGCVAVSKDVMKKIIENIDDTTKIKIYEIS